jgi:hypothetical protein
MPSPEDFIFSAQNQPFAPADRRSALEIINDSTHDLHHPEEGMETLKKTMLKSWAYVHTSILPTYTVLTVPLVFPLQRCRCADPRVQLARNGSSSDSIISLTHF